MTVIICKDNVKYKVELDGDYIKSYSQTDDKPTGKLLYNSYFQIKENPGFYDAYAL